jgi:hypothetical protein
VIDTGDSNDDVRSMLTRRAAVFLLWLLGAMALWAYVVEPVYDRLLAGFSIGLLHVVESPRMTGSVRFLGNYALVSHAGPFAHLGDQRLELRTHHNNVPLLVALILATPGLTWRRRVSVLLIAGVLLSASHVAHFVLTVHWFYCLKNVGPYRVTDLSYLHKGFWESLDNPAQTTKYLISYAEAFYTHVGRLLIPILLWMLFCWDAVVRSALGSKASGPELVDGDPSHRHAPGASPGTRR